MNKLSIFTLSSIAMAVAPTASAADIGIGVGLDADKLKIYFPVELEKVTIEPTIVHFSREESFTAMA